MNVNPGPGPDVKIKAEDNTVKPCYPHCDVVRFISIMLFCITTGLFSYLCVRSMDALNVVNTVQYVLMIVLGIGAGLIGFFIFKRTFLKLLVVFVLSCAHIML
jgi:hypothetical protein